MRLCRLALVAVLATLCRGSPFFPKEPQESSHDNLVSNPDFKAFDPATGHATDWTVDESVFSRVQIDTTRAALLYNGSAVAGKTMNCTQFSKTSPCWATQYLPQLRPGGRYKLRAVVRGGGAVTVQWERGVHEVYNWDGGVYPPAAPQDGDWHTVEEPWFVVPQDVDPNHISVSLFSGYMKYNSGPAWFTYVEVVELPPPSLFSLLASPAYRGVIHQHDTQLVAKAWLRPHSPYPLSLVLLAQFADATGKIISQGHSSRPALGQEVSVTVQLPQHDLTPGPATLSISCLPRHACVAQTHNLTVAPKNQPTPAAAIDSLGRLVLGGDRTVFPIGVYFSASDVNATTMQIVGDSHVGVIMPYGTTTTDLLDIAHAHNVSVVAALTDYAPGAESRIQTAVEQLRSHPALLGYYLSDEMGSAWLPQLVQHHDIVASTDRDHPTWGVYTAGQVASLGSFADAFDVAGTDPYPIGVGPGINASQVGDWTRYGATSLAHTKPQWMVIQAWNHNNTLLPTWPKTGTFRSPSLEELRSMTWQAICNGANGVFFYSFFEMQRNLDVSFDTMWRRVDTVAGEINALAKYLLSPTAPPPTATRPSWVATRSHWASTEETQELYILFAVSNGDGGGEVEWALPWRAVSVEVLGAAPRHIQPDERGQWRDMLAPLGLRAYKVQVQDRDEQNE